MGAEGEKAPLKVLKMEKLKKCGVFSCIKVIKMSSLTWKYMALEGLLSQF